MKRETMIKFIGMKVTLDVEVDGDPPVVEAVGTVVDVGEHSVWFKDIRNASMEGPKPTPLGMIGAVKVSS